jgi:hypothetical protein
MRFLEFLNEEQARKYSIEGACPDIKSECQPFLTSAPDYPLFRGISRNRNDETVLFSNQPTNRSPRDSNPPFNCLFNLMIMASFGIPDIRKRSIFCTGDRTTTFEYGYPHYVFPKGDYKILYSMSVIDSINYEDEWSKDIAHYIIDHVKELKHTEAYDLRIDSLFYRYADELTSWNKDWMTNPQEDQAEWFLEKFKLCVSTPLIKSKLDHLEPRELVKLFHDALKEMGTKLYTDDQNIKRAIKSGNEIFLYESEGYYAVPRGPLVDDYIKFYSKNENDHVNHSAQHDQYYEYLLKMVNNEI